MATDKQITSSRAPLAAHRAGAFECPYTDAQVRQATISGWARPEPRVRFIAMTGGSSLTRPALEAAFALRAAWTMGPGARGQRLYDAARRARPQHARAPHPGAVQGASAGQGAGPLRRPAGARLLAQTRRAYAKRGARPRKQRALTKASPSPEKKGPARGGPPGERWPGLRRPRAPACRPMTLPGYPASEGDGSCAWSMAVYR